MTTEEPGLPRITAENAAEYGPPSLNGFRTVSSHSREKAAPLFDWYWQMTGQAVGRPNPQLSAGAQEALAHAAGEQGEGTAAPRWVDS